MPGYLIQSLNSCIDLMIQHKYKNWIEVWRFFLTELSFFLSDFPQKYAFCQKSFHQKSPFYQNAAPSVCQVSLRNLLSVRFPSGIFFFLSDFPLKSPSFCQISLRNLLSVRFPSEIFFLSGFLQKAPSLCQFPLRKLLLSVRSQKYPSLC